MTQAIGPKRISLRKSKTLLLLTTFVGLVVVSGCTTAKEPVLAPVEPGQSVYGDYLIGQYAVRHRQMEQAIDFLDAVHQKQSLPTPMAHSIERQLFTILAGEGRIQRAADFAEQMGENDLLGVLVQIVTRVNAGEIGTAKDLSDQLTNDGLGAYVKPLIGAWMQAKPDDISQSIKVLAPLKRQEGLEALYNMHFGLLHDFAGRTSVAETYYKKATDGPGGISLRLAELYATMLIKQDRVAEAQKVYLDYFTDHPDSLYIQAMLDQLESGALAGRAPLTKKDGLAETLFGLASSLRSHSTRQAGLIMGQLALELKPDFPIAQILVAEILESDSRFRAANRVYDAIPDENPFSWSARLRMALNLDDLGETDAAIDVLENMIKQHPERLEAYVTLGDVLRHHKRFDRAAQVYGTAIELIGDDVQPHHWNLFYARAIALERLNRWEEAEPLFLKALELEPNQPYVMNYLGYSWVEIGRNLEQAQKLIEDAVAQRPRDGFIVDSLGWVLYRFGEYEQAVPHLERAVELQPSDPVINDHLGDAYWRVGRSREARFQWRRALSLNPEDELKSQIETKLERGLQD